MEKYEITEKNIGKGINSYVHKIINKKDKKVYIMKQISLDNLDKDNLYSIEKRIKILAQINHKNIIKYYESFKENNFINIIMEYCEGSNLRILINDYKTKNKIFDKDFLNSIIIGLFSGLKEIHNLDIFHGHLNPKNIFLDKNNNIKIIGLEKPGKLKGVYQSAYEKGIGNINYLAPEIISGIEFNNKADIWSLGCIIYELCTLNYCFSGNDLDGIIDKIKNSTQGTIDNKFYDLDLQNLINLALNKNHKKRPDINQLYDSVIKNKEKENQQIKNENKEKKEKNKNKKFGGDIKIIVIGSSSANKPQFVNRWTKNEITDKYMATIVSEFAFRLFEHEGKLYRIQLWDLAGQDKNFMIAKIFSKDTHGAVVMCDATNIKTRETSINWKRSVDENVCFKDGESLPIILVENKIDLLENNGGDSPSFDEFWEKNGFLAGFRVSSKTGQNVDASMNFLIKNIIKRLEKFNECNSNERKRKDDGCLIF